MHIKEGGLKKKEIDGFVFGSRNIVEKTKSNERLMDMSKENGVFGSGKNNVVGKIGDLNEAKAGKRMRQGLEELSFLSKYSGSFCSASCGGSF